MTAVGIAVAQELLAPGFLQSVKDKGNYFRDALLKLTAEHGLQGERGEGLLRALKLGSDIGPKIVDAARELAPVGLLLNSPRPDLLRFMPALNVTIEEIDQMVAMLSDVLRSIKQA
jgi:acetylornithine/N-succinyldiaminopimelate aminotransferase